MKEISADELLVLMRKRFSDLPKVKTPSVHGFKVTGEIVINIDEFHPDIIHLSFNQCEFINHVAFIRERQTEFRFSISNCAFQNDVNIRIPDCTLAVHETSVAQNLTCSSPMDKINFNDVDVDARIFIYKPVKSLLFSGVSKKSSTCRLMLDSLQNDGSTQIISSNFKVLELKRCDFIGQFVMFDCQVGKLEVEEVEFADDANISRNELGSLKFTHVIFKRKFNARHLTIKPETDGSLSFFFVDFNDKANFNHSECAFLDLFNCDFAGPASFKDFKTHTLSIEKTDFDKGADFFNLVVKENVNRETARSIKHELLKTNNFVDALHYKQQEMLAYGNELKRDKKYFDFFILWLNKWSNNYGISWHWGVRFILIVSLIGFFYYTLTLSHRPYSFQWKGFDSFMRGTDNTLQYYLQFLDITHKFDFMKDFHPNSASYLIDFVSKIFIGYGIFQTVAAFRKFGKGE